MTAGGAYCGGTYCGIVSKRITGKQLSVLVLIPASYFSMYGNFVYKAHIQECRKMICFKGLKLIT